MLELVGWRARLPLQLPQVSLAALCKHNSHYSQVIKTMLTRAVGMPARSCLAAISGQTASMLGCIVLDYTFGVWLQDVPLQLLQVRLPYFDWYCVRVPVKFTLTMYDVL